MSSNQQFGNYSQFKYPSPSSYKYYFQTPLSQSLQNFYPYQQNFYQFSMSSSLPLINQSLYPTYNPYSIHPHYVPQSMPDYGLPSSLLMKINQTKHQQVQKNKQNGNEKVPVTIDLCSQSQNEKAECQNISKKVSTVLENELQNQPKKSLRKNEKKSYKTADYCISIEKSIAPQKKLSKIRMLRLRKKHKMQKIEKNKKTKSKFDKCSTATRKTKYICKTLNANKIKKASKMAIQEESVVEQFIPLEIRIGQQYQCNIPEFIAPIKFQQQYHERILNIKMRQIIQDKQ